MKIFKFANSVDPDEVAHHEQCRSRSSSANSVDPDEVAHHEQCRSRSSSANSVDPDEVAHHEPPHLDLQCLPSGLSEFSI